MDFVDVTEAFFSGRLVGGLGRDILGGGGNVDESRLAVTPLLASVAAVGGGGNAKEEGWGGSALDGGMASSGWLLISYVTIDLLLCSALPL